jgi:exodeoxyribonuclease-3
MKIASWNINSMTVRLPNVLEWLAEHKPDVVLLQELKMVEDKFPKTELAALGYHAAVWGQKTYNGVAILSKHPLENVQIGLEGDGADKLGGGTAADEQARYIEAAVRGIRIACLYLPNGNPVESEKYPYKLRWMDRLYSHVQTLLKTEQPFILGGDYNVIPEDKDCHDPDLWREDALFKLETRKKFRALLHLGLTDALRIKNPNDNQYTFWDYQAGAWHKNAGIRIDHFLLSPQVTDLFENCTIDSAPRGKENPSDHVPIILQISA